MSSMLRGSCTWLLAVALSLACAVASAATQNVVLVIGDSISAAYGMPPAKGWVNLLADRLARKRFPHAVVNASVSGDTSAGALMRVPPLLRQHRPAVVIVEIGGNDALQGLPIANTRRNITQVVKEARRSGAAVILLGIDVPPSLGPKYVKEFQGIYASVAKATGSVLVPGFVATVGGDPDMMQSDGIHPNSFAQPKLLDTVWPSLEPLLKPKG